MKFFARFRSMQKMCTVSASLLTIILLITEIAQVKANAPGVNINRIKNSNVKSLKDFPVKGKVLDEKGLPLPGVSIKLRGTSSVTTTDINGNFNLSVPDDGGFLDISFLGYSTYSVKVSSSNTDLIVNLKPNVSNLNEVVVTAFSTQKRINVTGAIATIDTKNIVASPVGNITNALIGNAPGISGLQTSGEPGRNGTKIYIRGAATFAGGTNPLIVIDGVEQAAEQPYDQLNAMDANEIESVSILKDAASTAVYGIRAANGVIIVTTKRGRTGKPTLSFSSNFGATKATNLTESASSYDFALLRNQAANNYINSFNDPTNVGLIFTEDELWKFKNNRDYTPAEVESFSFLTAEQKAQLNQSPALYYGSHDYYKDQFDNTGHQQQYNLNIRGGSDKVKYYTSFGYFNQGSILEDFDFQGSHTGSRYNRSNFRSNFDLQPLKNTTISVSLAGQFGSTKGPSFGYNPDDNNNRYKQMMQYLQENNTFMVPGIIDGRLVTQVQGINGARSFINPLGDKQTFLNTSESILLQGGAGIYNNTLLSSSIKIKHTLDYLTKGLSIRGTASYDDSYSKFITISSSIPSYNVRRSPANPNELEFFGGRIGTQGFNGDSYTGTWNKLYLDLGIDYEKAIGGSNFTALILGKANRYNMPGGPFNTPSGVMGLVGRLTYNYKERYQAELNAGYNGTEQFAKGNRFGFFPAFSAGWVPTSEAFFPKNKYISFLKFRGSYGETGNDQLSASGAIRRYLFLPNTYNQNQGGYYFGTGNGVDRTTRYNITTEGALGNFGVTWERAIKTDIGMEARFFSNRLSMVLDFFKEERDNILTTLGIIPASFGVTGANIPPVNVGITQNKGYELTLGWRDQIGSFGYGINGSLSYAKNKVIYRAEAPNPYSWQDLTGKPIGQYFGLTSDGFFNTQEELANRPFNSFDNRITVGDIRYKDINGDGIIDPKDQSPIGFSNLPQYAFNTRVNLSYKGFDVSALLNGTANGSFYLPQNMVGVFYKKYGNVYQWQADGVWTPEKVANGTPITYPRMEINTGPANSNFLKSDFWLKSSDFVKVKNIEIGYTLRNLNVLQKLNISSMRLFANGNNLFTLKNDLKMYGLDPETADNRNGGYSNEQGYFFPITRVYNFGLNVQF